MKTTTEDKIKNVFKDSWKVFSNQFVVLILGTLVALILMIFIVTIPPLIYGLYYLTFQAIKGKKAKVSDIFEGFNYFFRSWGIVLLMAIGVLIGLVLLIIPGLLLMALWQFSIAIMVSEKKGITDSLKKSFDIAKKNMAFSIVFLIIVTIIGFLGGLTKVGTIITMPFTTVATCIATMALIKGKKK
jgi:hypothetical protein